MSNDPRSEPQPASQHAAQHHRRVLMKTRIRSVNVIILFVTWFMVALSGFLLYLAPSGPRSGWVEILILTKREWGEVHFWFAVAAIIVTVVHLIVDWKAVKSAVRFLVSSRRGHAPHE